MEECDERHPRDLDPAGRGGDADPGEAPGAADRRKCARRCCRPRISAGRIAFVATLPPRACVNELIISPTWNRFYFGGLESPQN